MTAGPRGTGAAGPPYGPAPRPTPTSAPHWSGGRDGELRVQRCEGCGRHVFNPALVCPFCTSTGLTWVISSGRGVVHTLTTVHRAPTPGVGTPYVVVVVELEEGWHMLSNVVGCPPDEVRIGMPVRVHFVRLSDEVWLPVFRPEAGR